MNHWTESAAYWLADVYLLSTLLLVAILLLLWKMGQPARRLAVVRATLAGLTLLAFLSAAPGWSLLHLLATPAATPVPPLAGKVLLPRPEAPVQAISDATIPQSLPEHRDADTASFVVEQPIERRVHWPTLVVATYFAGAAIVLGWMLLGALQTRRLCRQARPASVELQNLLATIVGSQGAVPRLLVSDRINSAVALGAWYPVVLLPAKWISDKRQLHSVLAHEAAHIGNGDLRLLAANRALAVLFWAQPLYWLLKRKIRLDQETLADAMATDVSSRHDYAEQLVAWAREATEAGTPRLASSVGLWEGPSQMRRRVAVLLDEKLTVLRGCSQRWRVGCAVLIAVVALSLSLVTLQPENSAVAEPPRKSAAEAALGEVKKVRTRPRKATIQPNKEQPGNGNDSQQGKTVESFDDWVNSNKTYRQRDLTPNAVAGNCVDERGQPLAGAEVTLYRIDEFHRRSEQLAATRSDENADFEFADLSDYSNRGILRPFGRPSRLVIVMRLPGRKSIFVQHSEARVIRKGWWFQQKLGPAATLGGRVTDGKGNPIGGAVVSLHHGSARFRYGKSQTTRTDENGNYAIDDAGPMDWSEKIRQFDEQSEVHRQQGTIPPVGKFSGVVDLIGRVYIEHPDYASQAILYERIPSTIDVKMGPPAVITGSVLLVGSGKPAVGVLVQATAKVAPNYYIQPLQERTPPQAEMVLTDEQGRYHFLSLRPDIYTVWLTHAEGARFNYVEARAGKTADVFVLQIHSKDMKP